MQRHPFRAKQRVVRRLLDQRVAEPMERRGSGRDLADQVRGPKPLEIGRKPGPPVVDRSALGRGENVRQQIEIELAPDDRRHPKHPPRAGRQAVDPRQEEPVDRLGDVDAPDLRRGCPAFPSEGQRAAVDQHPQGLFHEEGVAVGARDDPVARRPRQRLDLEQVCHEGPRVLVGERAQPQLVRVAELALHRINQPPARRVALVADGGHDEDRRIGDDGQELRERLRRRFVRPVEVLHHRHQRTLVGRGAEQVADRRQVGGADGVRRLTFAGGLATQKAPKRRRPSRLFGGAPDDGANQVDEQVIGLGPTV
jgi:hypothetical protein